MPQKSNFKDLINQYNIEIPRIQRDYAQGRITEKVTPIRKSIVDTIFDTLNGNNGEKDFNFVYGSTDLNNKFIPLDGQQRLTTLLLFHLYLEGVALSAGEDISPTDYKFSYSTRRSSDSFCKKLIENRADIMSEIKNQFDIFQQRKNAEKEKDREERQKLLDELKVYTPSQIIQNQAWFFSQWNSDPTIAGMLVMLDEIHSRYVDDIEKIIIAYHRLFDDKAITFQFQSLNNFTRTDDLFIKMNSRGLGLTDFEIFKSKLVEDFENNYTEKNTEFKNNIDVKWCDFLWQYRDKIKNDNAISKLSIDTIYQRALKYLIPTEAAAIGQNISIFSDELFERNKKSMRFTHNAYINCNVAFSIPLLKRLYVDLDFLFSKDSSPLSREEFPNNLLSNLLLEGTQFSYDESVIFYAWLRLKLIGADDNQISKAMNILTHIIKDSDIDSSDKLVNSIKSINKIIDQYNDSKLGIFEWLATNPILDLPGLSKYQFQEEIVKAKLRLTNQAWTQAIDTAEKDDFMDGQIGFILESSGVASVIDDIFCLTESISETQFDKFQNYLTKSIALFSCLKQDNEVIKNHLLVRALLKHGDYFIGDKRRNIANDRSDRDYSWHALLNVGRKHDNGRSVFKALLDDVDFDLNEIKTSLEKIASKEVPQSEFWIQVLSGSYAHQILERAPKGFLYFNLDENKFVNVRVSHTTQLNGFHDELYSLYVYLLLKSEKDYPDLKYNSVKSGEEDAYISFIVPSTTHEIQIWHWNNVWEFQYPDEWSKDKKENGYYSITEIKDYIKSLIDV